MIEAIIILDLKYNTLLVDLSSSIFPLQSIIPLVVRVIISIHMTDHVTSSVQHVPGAYFTRR